MKERRATMMNIVLAMTYILIGLLVMVLPQEQNIVVVYMMIFAMIATGCGMVASYFYRELYRNNNNYRFSFGVMLIFLGIYVFVMSSVAAQRLYEFMGIGVIGITTLMLQTSLQLRYMAMKIWKIFLAVTMFFYAMAFVSLSKTPFVEEKIRYLIAATMVCSGLCSAVGTVVKRFAVLKYREEKQKLKVKMALMEGDVEIDNLPEPKE